MAAMITPAYVQYMARYNRWQNENLYGAAERMPATERTRERGAFFGSIQATLSHLMYGDQAWMHRFEPSLPPPRAKSGKDSALAYADWDDLKRERDALDQTIIAWADRLPTEWLAGELTYFSGITQREHTLPRGLLVAHMFNHQTHHRGQVHCLLTQVGIKPGDTDMPFMPR
jgi:uncharacterized damage-inducible protein DinB